MVPFNPSHPIILSRQGPGQRTLIVPVSIRRITWSKLFLVCPLYCNLLTCYFKEITSLNLSHSSFPTFFLSAVGASLLHTKKPMLLCHTFLFWLGNFGGIMGEGFTRANRWIWFSLHNQVHQDQLLASSFAFLCQFPSGIAANESLFLRGRTNIIISLK